jgi:hypothetical protein
MFPFLENDQNWWSTGIAWAKGNLLPRIKHAASPGSRFTGTQHTISAGIATSRPGNAAPREERGEVTNKPDFTFLASMTNLTDIESSSDSRQPAYISKAAITSSAIFDDSFDVTPKKATFKSFGDLNPTQAIKAPAGVAGPNPDTVFRSLSTYEMGNTPTYRTNDESTLAKVLDTVPIKTGNIHATFDRMLDLPFQNAEGTWQAHYRTDSLSTSEVINAIPTELSNASRARLGLPQGDVKGKRPMYHEPTKNLDAFSPIYTDPAADVRPRGSPALARPASKASSTPLKCTCTPSDTKLALELYLQSTKKQHKQLEHALRRSGDLRYLFSTSTQNSGLVQKLSELYLNVKELYKLVMAEEIVSSVASTEIHRLMDKALTPVSEQFLVLYLGLRVADNGWRKRIWFIEQKTRESLETRMRGLASKVDQANAWVQLVEIRISRARFEW